MPLWGILGQNPKIQNTGHFSPVLSLLPGVDAIPCRYALIQAHMAHIAGVGDGSLRYGAGNAIQSYAWADAMPCLVPRISGRRFPYQCRPYARP